MVSKHLTWTGVALAVAIALSACGGGTGEGAVAPAKSADAGSTASADSAAGSGTTASTDVGTEFLEEKTGETFHEANAVPVVASPAANTANAGMREVAPLNAASSTSTSIDLGAPTNEKLAELRGKNLLRGTSNTDLMKPKVHQIGFTRPVSTLASVAATSAALSWAPTAAGGYRTSVQLSSDGAVKLRVGVRVEQLPDSAKVRVQGSGDTQAREVDGAFINRALAANQQADGISEATQTYWMPGSNGDVATLEIELPAGALPSMVRIAIPKIAHGVETAASVADGQVSARSACPLVTPDATCSLGTAANAINSSASYDFLVNGEMDAWGTCSGTLIADKAGSAANYFLTAHHCIDSQTEASTANFYWFNRSSTCDGLTENPGVAQSAVQGANYLFGQSIVSQSLNNTTGTDTALLRLSDTPPPVGTFKAGWTIDRQAVSSTNMTGIHHPAPLPTTTATWARRSDGRISGYGAIFSIDSQGNGTVNYDNTRVNFPLYRVNWTSGITESGSSGSALFRNATTTNPQVVGQLFGGSSTCAVPTNPDVYGRFDIGYEDGMINWLNPGYRMVFRMYNTNTGTHFYTGSAGERNNIRRTIPSFRYEGSVYTVASAPAAGLNPVFRFFNRRTGTHFYTISAGERDAVMNLTDFRYEGIAWYARLSTDNTAGTISIYRFFIPSKGTHFYTASEGERDNVIANLAGIYRYEGVAYKAWPRY
jgi:lysyl endopeptidase